MIIFLLFIFIIYLFYLLLQKTLHFLQTVLWTSKQKYTEIFLSRVSYGFRQHSSAECFE